MLISDISRRVNTVVGYLCGVSIVICAAVTVYQVIVRYVLVWPTDWENEFTVFLLLGTTFMGAAYTQVHRGHVGIEILENVLPPRANRWRDIVGSLLSLVVCAILAWQSWSLFAEAWKYNYVTESTWAPKLWVPYFFMALGLTILMLQLAVQILEDFVNREISAADARARAHRAQEAE